MVPSALQDAGFGVPGDTWVMRIRPRSARSPRSPHARRGRFIPYPTRQILAVLDDHTEAVTAVSELRASGVADDAILILRGDEGADRIGGMGAAHGIGARLHRWTAFTVMDQLPDFVLYERAVRDGRTVLGVTVRSEAEKRSVHEVLRRHGAHFANYYGRFATEELDLWRGPEPDIPGVLRR